MTGYVVILLGVNAYFSNHTPKGPLAYLAAALPALPIVAVFGLFARLLSELRDEYVRMLLIRQSLIATAFALSIATIWGFLEDFGLVQHVAGYWAAILWFMGLGVGGCANAVLERSARP
jgi:hypothetical protein